MPAFAKIISVACLTAAVAGLALAQTALDPVAAEAARSEHMKLYGAQMAVLGGMAQGQVPYDAMAAQAAADTLVTLTMVDQSTWWPVGSDSDSIANSRALPLIWTSMDDMIVKATALGDAALVMQTAAGTDLAALQAAMGAVGGACGACHELYRKPA